MSGIICNCNTPVKNLGLPGCKDIVKIPKRLIFVPTYKDNGTLNYITASDAIDTAAYWNALQYATDPQARFYPLAADIEDVEMAKSDTVYQEFKSGRKEFVRDGVRSFMGLYPSMAAPMIGKLKSKGCGSMSVFIVDNEGNLAGIEKTAGLLYPFKLSQNTLNAIFNFATDSTVPHVVVKFEFAQDNKDELISIIPADEIGIDLFTQFSGKQDTTIAQVGTGTATGFVIDVKTDFGPATGKIPVENLVLADFGVYNVTDSLAVTPTTVTEDTVVPGRYTFVVPTQGVADLEKISLAATDAAKPFSDEAWVDVRIKHQA